MDVGTRMLSRQSAADYLVQRGFSAAKAAEIADSFDWDEPVYVEQVWEGTRLRQYVRLSWRGKVEGREHDPSLNLGDFFGLTTGTLPGLAIGSGLTGRFAVDYVVRRTIAVLAGTAREMPARYPA